MSKSSKQPEYLTFRCPLTVEAADGEKGKQMPRFRMVAYTGGVMRIAGFPHPVVVDLEGLAIDRQDIPVRLDHNPRQGVGHTRRVVIENGHRPAHQPAHSRRHAPRCPGPRPIADNSDASLCEGWITCSR